MNPVKAPECEVFRL